MEFPLRLAIEPALRFDRAVHLLKLSESPTVGKRQHYQRERRSEPAG
jgi:hypothetical protein